MCMNYYKLRSSVSVVDLGDNCLEFFKTNTRKSIKIRTENDLIKKLVTRLDGNTSLEDIAMEYQFDPIAESTSALIDYLKRKSILANDGLVKNRADYLKYRRVIHFLEDYADSDESLLEMWNNIRNSRVVIVGMGAVGSWIAVNLIQSGVMHLVLVDNDRVELSNIHRQYGFTEDDIGKVKTAVIKERLIQIEPDAVIEECNMFLDEDNLKIITRDIDLVINCADKPTVDDTSMWIGKFCMERKIPHIVGGGYNLHLSLMGQTIIPFETACVQCFATQLQETNSFEGLSLKRLNIKNRKIGSFGPMCTIIASMTGMEAIKILSKNIKPDNVNRRGEFSIYDMDIKYSYFDKMSDCKWCGEVK